MSESGLVTFQVTAADSGTEIFLIDGDFKLVKKGIGRETFLVAPGIYKIKARSGTAAIEKMLIVRSGMPAVMLEPVMLNTAMPLRRSIKTHESHMAAAQQAAATPDLVTGSGSAIVIMARQWTAPQPTSPSSSLPQNPAHGLVLRDMSGAEIADIEKRTSVNTPFDPCVTLHVALNPGTYRLSLAHRSGRRVEQTLVACKGWQTHVYLLLDAVAKPDQSGVDLVNGAITMRRPSEGFNPDDPKLRLEEVARGALYDDRMILSEDIRSQIARPDAPPMFALLGAHLLIREAKDAKAKKERMPDVPVDLVDNRAAVRQVVDNLRAAIGAHPDVEAIAIGAGNPDPQFGFSAPPMLRASWRLLLKASVQRPEVLPVDSLGARVAERIWGEGPWLLWVDPDTTTAINHASLWQMAAPEMLSSIDRNRQATRAADGVGSTVAVSRGPVSTAIAAAAAFLSRVKALFTGRSRRPFPDLRAGVQAAVAERAALDFAGLRARLSDDEWRTLIKRLGVPRSRIDAWFDQFDQ
jgi:hypothetical protein